MNQNLIVTKEIRKIYKLGREEVHALRGVSLTIRRNEFVSIMGPSGSGKSTLLNILGCLDTPTSGEYFLNGKEISKLTDDDLALIRNKEIGFVFQVFNLLPNVDTYHNVELPLIYNGTLKKERRERVLFVLQIVGLSNRIKHKPSELSGGERQRVAIARALVNSPSLILADEPTGNLDSKTGAEILSLFERLHSFGNTIVMVTHDLSIAERTKRIIYLRDGEIENEKIL
ncbi:MAG: ABC transporter ATP-binding protein [Candidatus Aminicenantia bacterium]